MALAKIKGRNGSFIFGPLLLIIVIAMLTTAGFKLIALEKSVQKKQIGEMQIELINTYNDGEKALFFIEQSSKYSGGNALQEFYSKGGYFLNECGSINNYNLWIKGSQKCFLDKKIALEQFSEFLTSNINEYASNYDTPIQNKYVVREGKNTLTASGNEIEFYKEQFKYSIRPAFNVHYNEEISNIIEWSNKIKDNIDKCKSNIICWKGIDSNIKVVESNKVFYFDIDYKSVGFFEKKPLVLKFALDFNEYNPLFR